MIHPEVWPFVIDDVIYVLSWLGLLGSVILARRYSGVFRLAWIIISAGWVFHVVGETLWQIWDIDLLVQRWMRASTFRGTLVVGIWLLVLMGRRR